MKSSLNLITLPPSIGCNSPWGPCKWCVCVELKLVLPACLNRTSVKFEDIPWPLLFQIGEKVWIYVASKVGRLLVEFEVLIRTTLHNTPNQAIQYIIGVCPINHLAPPPFSGFDLFKWVKLKLGHLAYLTPTYIYFQNRLIELMNIKP